MSLVVNGRQIVVIANLKRLITRRKNTVVDKPEHRWLDFKSLFVDSHSGPFAYMAPTFLNTIEFHTQNVLSLQAGIFCSYTVFKTFQ